MNVANRSCIRSISTKSMRAAKTRNIIAILAIALTTLLFASLFTIALSINDAFQQSNFRMAGGYAHGVFKYLTSEKVDELKGDPLIKEYGLRRFVGVGTGDTFAKSAVELGYSDANNAHWMFCDPVAGKLPAEGTNEAATDTRVLALLGVEPKIGAQFTLTFDVDGTPTTETFTLSGYWEYDDAVGANHILMPASRAQAIFDKLGTTGKDGMTSFWNMEVMLGSASRIEQDINTILGNHGYQSEGRAAGDNYIPTGVNWGYTGAQISRNFDPATILAVVGLLALMTLTGYLIIYNVFRISVTNDIRFYGLLKTIGTTGRQIKRIVRTQALVLSVGGIPIGLLAGYGVGVLLVPIVLTQLNGVQADTVSANPLIFVGAALFSLVTVLISCAKPGRMAARVSPVEAVRYTEGGNTGGKIKMRRTQKGASLPQMALANLGRSRSKTAVTVASLSLAVVLLNLTVTFTNGFSMDKYLSRNMATDFVFSSAGYFQSGSGLFSAERAVPEEVVSQVAAQPGIEAGGRIYGQSSAAQEFVTEDYFRQHYGQWNDAQGVNSMMQRAERNDAGMLGLATKLYGMERFALDKLRVVEGDISQLYEPGSRSIAAVYAQGDYGEVYEDSHWAKLGDKVTLRHVDEYEYYAIKTGEILDPENLPEDIAWAERAKTYRDVEYTVAARVTVPSSLCYRYYGSDEFVLNDKTFIEDTKTSDVMLYACDMQDGTTDAPSSASADMEAFLSDFTQNVMTQFGYESKLTSAEEFYGFRNMFLMLGGALSFIVGLVGVLNFINAILTGILTRRREFAVLQSVGMTGKQLKTMLMIEGLCYALCAALVSFVLCVASGPLLGQVFTNMFWFFEARFTIWPVLVFTPIFAALGAVLPLLMYRTVEKRSVVERLREAE